MPRRLTEEIEAGAPVQVIVQSEDSTISLDSDSWGAPIEEADDGALTTRIKGAADASARRAQRGTHCL